MFDFNSDGKVDSVDGSWLVPSSIRSQHGYHNSSSNSNSSSISSISTSSDSDYKMNTGGTGDLEADADSLTCRQSGLSSADQFHNGGLKMVLPFHLFILMEELLGCV